MQRMNRYGVGTAGLAAIRITELAPPEKHPPTPLAAPGNQSALMLVVSALPVLATGRDLSVRCPAPPDQHMRRDMPNTRPAPDQAATSYSLVNDRFEFGIFTHHG